MSEGTQYWGPEGILCGVMNLKNLKVGSMKVFSPRKILSFSQLEIAFWVILHQIGVGITCLVSNAAANYRIPYKLHVLMQTGMKQNAFSYIISSIDKIWGVLWTFLKVEGF